MACPTRWGNCGPVTTPFSPFPTPGDLLGPYRVIREVGRGGMATVMEVEDTRNGERRAVKLMLPSGRGEELTRRFRSEFRALSRLSHPNVLRVYEGGLFNDRPYFIMELLLGVELREEINLWRELSPGERLRRAESVLIQVARALEYIHARGFVHRDVTPTNIFVQPDGVVKLMDFGVVKEPGGEVTTVGEVVGTVAYMAPEQIACGRVDARADLYSLGVVLYLMLTGRRPFNARTMAGYLEKHLNRPVRPPSELVPTLPRKLDEVCTRLLAKDPADRFASATHLLHVLEADATPEVPPDPAAPGWRPSLVGRAAEQSLLREAVVRLAKGRGGVLLIEGASGMGKTRLAEDGVEQGHRLGLKVYTAANRSLDQLAFSGFRLIYEELRERRGDAPSPVLEAAFGAAIPGAAPLERLAVGAAFKELFSSDQPTLVFMDDVDRADRGTLDLLAYLIRAMLGMAHAPVLFILTAQRVEGEDHPLRALVAGEETGVGVIRLPMGPLPLSAVEAMLLALVVDDPGVRALAMRLHREGEGNPFFISEMLHGLVERRVLIPGKDGNRGTLTLDEAAVRRSSLPVPATLREAILQRLDVLGPEVRAVAASLAVTRQDAGIDLLLAATNLDEDRVLTALDQLLEAGLVRERRAGMSERYELAHNRVRGVLLDETPEDELSAVATHEMWGQVYDRLAAEADHELQRRGHFEQGGLAAKAYPYLLQSAEQLLSRGFMAEALQLLDRALVAEHAAREYLTLNDSDRALSRLLLRRASALFLLGRWAEAESEATRADDLATEIGDPALTASTATELGTQARRRHQLGEAERQLRRALEEAHRAGDRTAAIQPLYEYGGLLWLRGDLEAARGYWVEVLAAAKAASDDRSLALGYNGLGLLALCKGQGSDAREFLEQAVALCERHGMVERQVVSNTNLVELYNMTGYFRKGLQLSDRTVSQAREMNHLLGIGLGLFYRAFTLMDIGRVTEAEQSATEALAIQREMANHDDEVRTLLLLARVALERGDLQMALARLSVCEGLSRGYDSEGFTPLVLAWRACALASSGEHAAARAALAQAEASPGRPWVYQRVRYLLSLSRAWRLLGERERALDAATEALAISERCGFRYYVLLSRVFAARVSPPAEAAAHERLARALATSLAGGLDREDAHRFLSNLGFPPVELPQLGANLEATVDDPSTEPH